MNDELIKSINNFVAKEVKTKQIEERKEQNKIYEYQKRKLYNLLGTDLVRLFSKEKVIIAGGSINSIFTNRDINDIDTYFRDDKSLASVIDYLFKEGYWVICNTKKAILFKNNEGVLIQLIHYKKYNNAEEIFNSFDFTACMGAFDFKNEEFVFDKHFMIDNMQNNLRFNSNTDYPLMSLLRVEKYKNKGYNISKSEFIRIMLTCMNTKINTLDELKEQIGGMYGLNLSKLFKDVKVDDNLEVNLAQVIDSLKDLYLDEDYFKNNEGFVTDFNNSWELINQVTKDIEMDYMVINNKEYMIDFDGKIEELNRDDEDFKNIKFNKIELSDYLENKKFYKFVGESEDGELYSFYNTKFKYEVGKEISALKDNYNDGNIYFTDWDEISTYSDRDNRVLLELTIRPEDMIIDCYQEIRASKVFVNRIVPEEEYPERLKK